MVEEAGTRAHTGFMTEYWAPQSKGSAPVPRVGDMLERGGRVPYLPTTVMPWHTWQVTTCVWCARLTERLLVARGTLPGHSGEPKGWRRGTGLALPEPICSNFMGPEGRAGEEHAWEHSWRVPATHHSRAWCLSLFVSKMLISVPATQGCYEDSV